MRKHFFEDVSNLESGTGVASGLLNLAERLRHTLLTDRNTSLKAFAMGFRCFSESGCTLAGDLRMETTVTADQELPKTWRRPLWAPITTQTITNDGTTKTGHFLMRRIWHRPCNPGHQRNFVTD